MINIILILLSIGLTLLFVVRSAKSQSHEIKRRKDLHFTKFPYYSIDFIKENLNLQEVKGKKDDYKNFSEAGVWK